MAGEVVVIDVQLLTLRIEWLAADSAHTHALERQHLPRRDRIPTRKPVAFLAEAVRVAWPIGMPALSSRRFGIPVAGSLVARPAQPARKMRTVRMAPSARPGAFFSSVLVVAVEAPSQRVHGRAPAALA